MLSLAWHVCSFVAIISDPKLHRISAEECRICLASPSPHPVSKRAEWDCEYGAPLQRTRASTLGGRATRRKQSLSAVDMERKQTLARRRALLRWQFSVAEVTWPRFLTSRWWSERRTCRFEIGPGSS